MWIVRIGWLGATPNLLTGQCFRPAQGASPAAGELTPPPATPRIRVHAGIAQLVERVIRNDEVVGSIPISGTKN
jgi:hypothetical protein